MMRELLFISILILSSLGALSQDVIYKKDNTKIDCKVVEVGPVSVKYSLNEGVEPFLELQKSQILVLQYENGDHEIFTTKLIVNQPQSNETGTVNNSISFNFLDIIFLRLHVSYEHINKAGNIGIRVPLTLGMYENELKFAIKRLLT